MSVLLPLLGTSRLGMNSDRDKVLAMDRHEEVTRVSATSHSNKSEVIIVIMKSSARAHSSFLLAVSSSTEQQQNKKITCYFVLGQWQYEIINTNIIAY